MSRAATLIPPRRARFSIPGGLYESGPDRSPVPAPGCVRSCMFSFQRITAAVVVAAACAALPSAAGAAKKPAGATFSFGQPQAQTVGATGCGTNVDGEPAIHVSRANDVFLGSERGVGSGSDAWRALTGVGGPGAN